MSDPAILFVKPGAIKAGDKGALRKAGVVVVEVEDPSAVNFIRPTTLPPELPGGAIMRAAALAMRTAASYESVTNKFGQLLCRAIEEHTAPPTIEPEPSGTTREPDTHKTPEVTHKPLSAGAP